MMVSGVKVSSDEAEVAGECTVESWQCVANDYPVGFQKDHEVLLSSGVGPLFFSAGDIHSAGEGGRAEMVINEIQWE